MNGRRCKEVAGVIFLTSTIVLAHGIDTFRIDPCHGGNKSIDNYDDDHYHHSRKERFIFMSSDRRLSLPPTSWLKFDANLRFPALRNLPTGYKAGANLQTRFILNFDKLGLTSEDNLWSFFPYYHFEENISSRVNRAGGDRLMMFKFLEDSLESLGLNGKPCLLRAICESFEKPLANHGFFGELLELFFSVRISPHVDNHLAEYMEAETAGRKTRNCSWYYGACQYSLFSITTKEYVLDI